MGCLPLTGLTGEQGPSTEIVPGILPLTILFCMPDSLSPALPITERQGCLSSAVLVDISLLNYSLPPYPPGSFTLTLGLRQASFHSYCPSSPWYGYPPYPQFTKCSSQSPTTRDPKVRSTKVVPQPQFLATHETGTCQLSLELPATSNIILVITP